eukprot:6191213-Pleurochrysis_carterae.AAC.2
MAMTSCSGPLSQHVQVGDGVAELGGVDLHVRDDGAGAEVLPLLVVERERLLVHHLADRHLDAQRLPVAAPEVLAHRERQAGVRGEHAEGAEKGHRRRKGKLAINVRDDRVDEQRVSKVAGVIDQLQQARLPEVCAKGAVEGVNERVAS